MDLATRLLHLPRHLGQHSGGMVIAAGRLNEVVPLQPSAMDDRVVVQLRGYVVTSRPCQRIRGSLLATSPADGAEQDVERRGCSA